MSSCDIVVKSIVIGDSCVGKTSIVQRLTMNDFKQEMGLTIGVEFNVKYFEIDGKVIKLQIWDTAGQEIFRSITLNYFRDAVIAFLVFYLTNKKSFDNCKYWIDTIRENSGENTFICLLGNKNDLKQEIKVLKEDIDFLVENEDLVYNEISAKDDYKIKETFKTAITELYCKILRNENEYYRKHKGIVFNNEDFSGALQITKDDLNTNNDILPIFCQKNCCDI